MTTFLRRHARLFVAAAGFSGVLNLALLVPSLYMLQVYDRVLPARSPETLWMLSAVAAAALGLMFVLDWVRGRLLALAGSLFEREVGGRCVRQLLDGGVPEPAGALQAHALRDVSVLHAFFAGPGLVSLFDAPWMPVYIGVVFLFDPALGLLALGCAAVLGLLAWVNERATRAGVNRGQQQSRELGRFTDGALRHAEVVRAMGMSPAVEARWQVQSDAWQTQQLQTQRVGGLIGSLTKCFRQSVQVAMLAAAAWLVIGQKATPGVMIAVTVILGRALAPVEMLIGQWKQVVEARAAWQRLTAWLSSAAPAPATDLPAPTGAITLDSLVYLPPGSQRATIRQLSLNVAAGEVLAIVGPSGSGKSTLARLMLGIVQPAAGAVRLDGAALTQWAPARLGPHIGYLPQDVALFDGTVADNIGRLGDLDSAAVVEAAQSAHAHTLIVQLPQGYDTPVGEGGRCLSGGQRQRIALARALCGRPRLVVLDEPNANLDSDGEDALKQAIGDLRERGATVVLITQRTQILSVADRIVVMRDGAIERIGVRQAKASDDPTLATTSADGERSVPTLHQVSEAS
ncbi:type I secretion system permease/ATPase [Ideonella sp.]|uniref:type I secretion system permease/ATPase n=1 Tax=Ideonella sp. TaxID=1929293 RepID=UPI0035B28405